MKISKNRKRTWYWILGILVFGILFVVLFENFALDSSTKGIGITDSSASPHTIFSFPRSVGTELTRALIKKYGRFEKLNISDVTKFDLNLPDSPDRTGSGDLSIFHDLDKKKLNELLELSEIYKLVTKSGKQIFTLGNRISGLGSDQPELLFFISDVREDVCEAVNKQMLSSSESQHDELIPLLTIKPNLTPYPALPSSEEITTIDYRGYAFGCFKSGETNYFFQVIYVF